MTDRTLPDPTPGRDDHDPDLDLLVTLTALLGGTAPAVVRHVAGCAACGDALEQLIAVHAGLREEVLLSPALRERIGVAVDDASRRDPTRRSAGVGAPELPSLPARPGVSARGVGASRHQRWATVVSFLLASITAFLALIPLTSTGGSVAPWAVSLAAVIGGLVGAGAVRWTARHSSLDLST